MALSGIRRPTLVPRIATYSCFNKQQKRYDCTRCRDMCPSGAISYEDRETIIDEDVCEGCHLCTGICLTSCIGSRDGFMTASDTGGRKDSVGICCSRANKDQGNLFIPCIASAPWELYAYLSYDGVLAIVTGDCNTCRYGAKEYVQTIYDKLERFWGERYPSRIWEIFDEHKDENPAEKHYSRREMIGMLNGGARKYTETALGSGEEYLHSAEYRNVLLNELKEGRKKNVWPELQIDKDACTKCTVCEKICLYDAMDVREDGVHHDGLLCIECGLCTKCCPQKCISII